MDMLSKADKCRGLLQPYLVARAQGVFIAGPLKLSTFAVCGIVSRYPLVSLNVTNTNVGLSPSLWANALQQCPTLTEIHCTGTPLYGDIPYEHRTPKGVLEYLRDYGGGFDDTSHLRVQLCGNYNVGKTALREGLLEGKVRGTSLWFWQKRDESTAGAEIVTTRAETVGRRRQKVVMRVVDLGGQEEYYASHHLLMPSGAESLSLFLWDMRVVLDTGEDPAKLAVATRAVDWMSSLVSSGQDVAVMVVGSNAANVGTDMARFSRLFERVLVETVTALGGAVVVNGHDLQYLDAAKVGDGQAPTVGGPSSGQGDLGKHAMTTLTMNTVCQRCHKVGISYTGRECPGPPSAYIQKRVHLIGMYAAESPSGIAWRLPGAGYFAGVSKMTQPEFAHEVAEVGHRWLCRNATVSSKPGCLLQAYLPVMTICQEISADRDVITFEGLMRRTGVEERTLKGALRSLTVMGNVAWFDTTALRRFVFVRPQWVLDLVFLVFYVKHLHRNKEDERDARIVAPLPSYPASQIGEEEKKSLLGGQISYSLGQKLFSKLLSDGRLLDGEDGVGMCFDLLRQAGIAHPLYKSDRCPLKEQIFQVPVVASRDKPSAYEIARGISDKVQVLYKMDILPVGVQSSLMTKLYDVHAAKVGGGTAPSTEEFSVMEHWLGDEGLSSPIVLDASGQAVAGSCGGTMVECCWGAENLHVFLIVEFGRGRDTLFWRPATEEALSSVGCCVSLTVVAAEAGRPVGRRSQCDAVVGAMHFIFDSVLFEHNVEYDRLVSVFDIFLDGGQEKKLGLEKILEEHLKLSNLAPDSREFQIIAKCFRNSNRPDDAGVPEILKQGFSWMRTNRSRHYPNAEVVAVRRLDRPGMIGGLVKYAASVPGCIQPCHRISGPLIECTTGKRALPDLRHPRYLSSCRGPAGCRKDVFLWHGANWGVVHQILQGGFKGCQFSHEGAALGKGNYFADNSCKALNYSRCSVCGQNGWCKTADCPGVYCIILARVVLGKMDVTDSYRRTATGPVAEGCSSTVAYGKKFTGNYVAFNFSEFITYVDEVSCYPEYVVTIRKGDAASPLPVPIADPRMPCGVEVVILRRDVLALVEDVNFPIDCMISSENSSLKMGSGDGSVSAYVALHGGEAVRSTLLKVGEKARAESPEKKLVVSPLEGTVLWTGAGGLAKYGLRGIVHAIVIETKFFRHRNSGTFENVADVFQKALRLANTMRVQDIAVRYPFTSKSKQSKQVLQNAMMSVLEKETVFLPGETVSLKRVFLCFQ